MLNLKIRDYGNSRVGAFFLDRPESHDKDARVV
jgi:hypothetical protein